MDFRTMEIEAIEARKSEILEEMTAEGADLDALEEEMRSIREELETRKAEAKAKAEAREKIAAGEGETIEKVKEERKEVEKFGIETKEYRDAFMANLIDKATPEQRAILADNSAYGDGLSLPIELDTNIWDQVSTAHPILADVDIRRTGVAIKVTKMTPAAVTKKMDSANSTEQTFTSAEVILVGADFHTFVKLSFAEAKMSQGAMEDFLVKEIADAIGEALAKDVFARILTDATSAQKVTPATGSTMFENVKLALALATQARTPVIYAPASSYYEIVGAIAQGSPFNIGTTLGCAVKLDAAATKVTILDPSMFVLNVIQDVAVESQKDVQNAQFIIGGYMRAEGCLRKTKAAAYID